MKTSLVLMALSATMASFCLYGNATNVVKLSREQRLEKARSRTGGFIIDNRGQVGTLVFINAQTSVKDEIVSAVAAEFAAKYRINVKVVVSRPLNFHASAAATKEHNANAAIVISDMAGEPTFVVAPDDCIAFINIHNIKGGDFDLRVRRQLTRAFAYVCGSGSTSYPGNIMGHMKAPESLEQVTEPALTYDVEQNIEAYLPTIGITQGKRVHYLRACKEGWAPAPVDKYQKKIWDEIHSIPDNPLKIEYDPTTQKGKVTK